jgi:hypothetical protein
MACEILETCEVISRVVHGGEQYVLGKDRAGRARFCKWSPIEKCRHFTRPGEAFLPMVLLAQEFLPTGVAQGLLPFPITG